MIYWKEYFPLNSTPRNIRSSDRIIKYSLTAVVSSIRIPLADHPNSGEKCRRFDIPSLFEGALPVCRLT